MTERFPLLRKSTVFTLDVLAVVVGALIAAPFVIVFISPFIDLF